MIPVQVGNRIVYTVTEQDALSMAQCPHVRAVRSHKDKVLRRLVVSGDVSLSSGLQRSADSAPTTAVGQRSGFGSPNGATHSD